MNSYELKIGSINTLFFEIPGDHTSESLTFSLAKTRAPGATIIFQVNKTTDPTQVIATLVGGNTIVKIITTGEDVEALAEKIYYWDIRGTGNALYAYGALRSIFGVLDTGYSSTVDITALAPAFKTGIRLTPLPNGTNKIFTIPVTTGKSLMLNKEKIFVGTGRMERVDSLTDHGYIMTNNIATFAVAPEANDTLLADWIEGDAESTLYDNFIYGLPLDGLKNDSNQVFTIPVTYGRSLVANKEEIYYGGTRLTRNISYTIIGNTVTFLSIVPSIDDSLIADWVEE
jgi:hypothetical protein